MGWKIDTRADGGYVLAAGSTLASGSYVVIDDRDPVTLPYWVANNLTLRPAPPPRNDVSDLPWGRASGYVKAAVRAETQRIQSATRGQHNYPIYLAAVALGQLVAGRVLIHADAPHRPARRGRTPRGQ